VLGRAASGGALAPEPPRATRNTPEFIRNFLKNTLFFSFFWVQPAFRALTIYMPRLSRLEEYPRPRQTQRFGQFLDEFLNDFLDHDDFLCDNLDFLCENLDFLHENLRFSL